MGFFHVSHPDHLSLTIKINDVKSYEDFNDMVIFIFGRKDLIPCSFKTQHLMHLITHCGEKIWPTLATQEYRHQVEKRLQCYIKKMGEIKVLHNTIDKQNRYFHNLVMQLMITSNHNLFKWKKDEHGEIILHKLTFPTLCIKFRDRLLNINRDTDTSIPHPHLFLSRFTPGEKVMIKTGVRTVTMCRFAFESVFNDGICLLDFCTITSRHYYLQCNHMCIWKENEYQDRFSGDGSVHEWHMKVYYLTVGAVDMNKVNNDLVHAANFDNYNYDERLDSLGYGYEHMQKINVENFDTFEDVIVPEMTCNTCFTYYKNVKTKIIFEHRYLCYKFLMSFPTADKFHFFPACYQPFP